MACPNYALTVDPERPETGEEVTATVDLWNADASEFRLDWDVPEGTVTTQEPTYSLTYADAGFYEIAVTVRPPRGESTALSTEFTVVCDEEN